MFTRDLGNSRSGSQKGSPYPRQRHRFYWWLLCPVLSLLAPQGNADSLTSRPAVVEHPLPARGDFLAAQICGALPQGALLAFTKGECEDGPCEVVRPDVALRFVDLNEDGQMDGVAGIVAVAARKVGQDIYSCRVAVLMRKGHGFERVWESDPLGYCFVKPYYLSVFDITGDGRLEIVSCETGFGWWGMHIWRWDAAKNAPVQLYSGMAEPRDLDGDGVVELLDRRINQALRFWSFRGGSELASCPVVLKWENTGYRDVSRRFPELYRPLILKYRKEAAGYETRPDTVERVAVFILVARCYYLVGESKAYESARAEALRVLDEFEQAAEDHPSKELYAETARGVIRQYLPAPGKR